MRNKLPEQAPGEFPQTSANVLLSTNQSPDVRPRASGHGLVVKQLVKHRHKREHVSNTAQGGAVASQLVGQADGSPGERPRPSTISPPAHGWIGGPTAAGSRYARRTTPSQPHPDVRTSTPRACCRWQRSARPRVKAASSWTRASGARAALEPPADPSPAPAARTSSANPPPRGQKSECHPGGEMGASSIRISPLLKLPRPPVSRWLSLTASFRRARLVAEFPHDYAEAV